MSKYDGIEPNFHPPEKRALAAALVQTAFRAYTMHRSTGVALYKTVNVKYELQLSKERLSRRVLFSKFLRSFSYVLLLVGVVFLQYGSTVYDRFSLEKTMKEFIYDIRTPADSLMPFGMRVDMISDFTDYMDWVEHGLFARIVSEGRVWVSTYNQVVGSVRLENIRVTDESCAWKNPRALAGYQLVGELEACYGPIKRENIATEPFGPEYDSEVFSSTEIQGQPRYVIDLGRDRDFALERLKALRDMNYLSMSTRMIKLTLLVYNNALPMFCTVRVIGQMEPTGLMTITTSTRSVNVHVSSCSLRRWSARPRPSRSLRRALRCARRRPFR